MSEELNENDIEQIENEETEQGRFTDILKNRLARQDKKIRAEYADYLSPEQAEEAQEQNNARIAELEEQLNGNNARIAELEEQLENNNDNRIAELEAKLLEEQTANKEHVAELIKIKTALNLELPIETAELMTGATEEEITISAQRIKKMFESYNKHPLPRYAEYGDFYEGGNLERDMRNMVRMINGEY